MMSFCVKVPLQLKKCQLSGENPEIDLFIRLFSNLDSINVFDLIKSNLAKRKIYRIMWDIKAVS